MIGAADLSGHWQRAWIEAPDLSDGTTRVHWLQAGDGVFADIRIPANRPDVSGATCLAQLPQPVLAELLRAEGFAGTIAVSDSVCTWHRRLNLHGHPAPVDAGLMHRAPDGGLYEDGVHARYRELWHRQPAAPFRAALHASAARTVIAVFNETRFLVASEPAPHPAIARHRDALRRGEADARAARAAFAGQYTLGLWQGADGIATLSTNPFAETRPALSRTKAGLVWHETLFEGGTRDHALPQPQMEPQT